MKSPALRGFVGERWALATTSLYPVLKSNRNSQGKLATFRAISALLRDAPVSFAETDAFRAGIDTDGCISSHAPNTASTLRSNRFAVFTSVADEPSSKIANNGATGVISMCGG